MEPINLKEKNTSNKIINKNDDEKRKIISNIVKKSILCSKTTMELTTKIIDSIASKDKEKLISICEEGLPDDLPELRSLIRKINFGYLPLNMNEWDKLLKSKRISYRKYKDSIMEKLEKELELFKDYDKMTKEEKKNWIKRRINLC